MNIYRESAVSIRGRGLQPWVEFYYGNVYVNVYNNLAAFFQRQFHTCPQLVCGIAFTLIELGCNSRHSPWCGAASGRR